VITESSAPTSTRLVAIGDSVTDCGRDRTDPAALGRGWVARLAEALDADTWTVVNRGISGNRVPDLQARWQSDALDEHPDVLAIMIGINDTWRRYDRDDPTSAEAFEAGYRDLLEQTRGTVGRVVLIEPLLTPVRAEQWIWREDLDPKIAVVRRLAQEFGCALVPTDGVFNAHAATRPLGDLAADGVHPTPAGHALIRDTVLRFLTV